MKEFSLTGDEGSYQPPGEVRLFVLIEEKFSADTRQVLNRFYGWADTEPSSPVTVDLREYVGSF